MQAHDLNAFRYVYHYQIAKAVPFNATIGYAELAATLGLDVGQLKQMIRQLIQLHVFCEPQPDHVAHTASSKLLLHWGVGQFNGFISEDTFSIASKQIEALEKWGHGSQEPNQAALNYAYHTDKPMYDYYEENADVRERFSKLMTYVSGMHYMSDVHIAAGFDWAALGEGTVVDVAGNVGHCSVTIARANPKLRIVVQDMPEIIKSAQDPATSVIPEDLRDRFTFMVHDFYTPQPVEADVYFLRMILHDYSDKYAAKILKGLVPAMKPNHSRIVVMDQLMPPVGAAPPVVERIMRTVDLQMMMLTNAKERDYGEWAELFKAADPRLKIKNVANPPGSIMSLIEVVLEGDEGPDGHV